MKKCPYCAEQIQDEALKCRFCNEFLDGRKREAGVHQFERPWHFRDSTIIVSLLCVPPFPLPLVWFNPYYSRKLKIIVTVVVLGLAIVFFQVVQHYLKVLNEYASYLM